MLELTSDDQKKYLCEDDELEIQHSLVDEFDESDCIAYADILLTRAFGSESNRCQKAEFTV